VVSCCLTFVWSTPFPSPPDSNISFWIDGMNSAGLVDYWPKWVNIPNNEAYLKPGDVSDGTEHPLERSIP
jgi:uncharacterized membrane protein